ncbi:nitrilase-related carbon-nitrogen hydrolase [Cupriavidus basilensis]
MLLDLMLELADDIHRITGDTPICPFVHVTQRSSARSSAAIRARDVVARLLAHLHPPGEVGCHLVVFPELALTTFFPRWYIEDPTELNAFYEREMPDPRRASCSTPARLGIGFYLGYAELALEQGVERRYSTAILVGRDGKIIGKYRKVHLPGHDQHRPLARTFQHLGAYFEPGDDWRGRRSAASWAWRCAMTAAGRKPTA